MFCSGSIKWLQRSNCFSFLFYVIFEYKRTGLFNASLVYRNRLGIYRNNYGHMRRCGGYFSGGRTQKKSKEEEKYERKIKKRKEKKQNYP